MKIPCEMIRDLLPLYIDGVCSEASRAAVEAHLAECETCRASFDAMRTAEQNTKEEMRDMKLMNGMKNLKKRFDKRMKFAVLAAVALVCCAVLGAHLLLEAPLKALKPDQLSVSAEVYAAGELPTVQVDEGESAVSITKGPDDGSDMMRVEIPAMPYAEITMSENTLDELEYITVINWSSDYFLREIISREDGDTLYVNKIKTTLLDNRAEEKFKTTQELVTGRIGRIIYVDENGGETLMWEAPAALVNSESAME